MKRVIAILSIVLMVFGLSPSATQGKLNPSEATIRRNANAIPEHYIVRFKDEVSPKDVKPIASSLVNFRNSSVIHYFQFAIKGFSVVMSEAEAEELSKNPLVAYVEEDAVISDDPPSEKPQSLSSSPFMPLPQANPPWGLDRIDQRDLPLDNSYSYTNTGAGVNVYVIGNGVIEVGDSGVMETGDSAAIAPEYYNSEIYLIYSDGSNRWRLTYSDDADDYLPVWSPNGAKIAFQSSTLINIVRGDSKICVINADGTEVTELTANLGSPVYEYFTGWSPDSSRVAFYSGQYEIYTVNADNTNPTRLTNNTVTDLDAIFLADGARLLFTTIRDSNYDIYVMNADGSNQTAITNNPADDSGQTLQPM